MITGQVRPNNRRGVRQHALEPIEKQGMHVREMTSVFVSRPAARPWSPLQDTWRDLTHEWQHDVWRPTQRVNNGRDSVHKVYGDVCGGLTPEPSCGRHARRQDGAVSRYQLDRRLPLSHSSRRPISRSETLDSPVAMLRCPLLAL